MYILCRTFKGSCKFILKPPLIIFTNVSVLFKYANEIAQISTHLWVMLALTEKCSVQSYRTRIRIRRIRILRVPHPVFQICSFCSTESVQSWRRLYMHYRQYNHDVAYTCTTVSTIMTSPTHALPSVQTWRRLHMHYRQYNHDVAYTCTTVSTIYIQQPGMRTCICID